MGKQRIEWIDQAKALGIFLVFYGHLAEAIVKSGSAVAHSHYKLIYAFHMPMFFFLAGFFWKPPGSYSVRVKRLVLRRLLPVAFFGALLLPVWPIYQWLCEGGVEWNDIMWRGLDYLHGAPRLAWTTWFLVCLCSCELLAMAFLSRVRTRWGAFVFGVLILLAGLFMCEKIWAVKRMFGVYPNTWFIHEAVVALGFYAMGHGALPLLMKMSERKTLPFIVAMLSLAVLVTTYDMNAPSARFIVAVTVSSHGEMIPFLVSALSGIMFIVALAAAAPLLKPILFLGRNTLVLLGLNAVFLHFMNASIVARCPPPADLPMQIVYCLVVTVVSLLLCVPAILLLNKFVPQLVGSPQKAGPWLPRLESDSGSGKGV